MGVLNLRLSNDRAEKKVPQEVEGMTACHASEDRGPWYGVTLPSTFESASAMLKPLRLLGQDIEIAAHRLRHGGSYELDGLVLSVPPGMKRDIKHQIIRGDYEKDEIELARRWIDPNLPLIELGGCMGILSAHLRRLLAPTMQLVIVEANPGLAETCEANATRRSSNAHTHVICAAVAYGVDHVDFHLNRNVHVSGIASADKKANHRSPAVTLGKLVREQLPVDTDYTLVCDIEGCEYDVLEKDADALGRCKLAIIEVHPQLFDDQLAAQQRFESLARAAGFIQVDGSGSVVVLKR
jgi:FkbM family methyltransferase